MRDLNYQLELLCRRNRDPIGGTSSPSPLPEPVRARPPELTAGPPGQCSFDRSDTVVGFDLSDAVVVQGCVDLVLADPVDDRLGA